MKKSLLIMSMILVSLTVAAGEVSTIAADSNYNILSRIVGVHRAYSQAAGIEAKAFEAIGGDGMNALRVILTLDNGYGSSKSYELAEMLSSVTRITFLSKNEIVINAAQETFADENGDKSVTVKKSIKVNFRLTGSGDISDEVSVEDISRNK